MFNALQAPKPPDRIVFLMRGFRVVVTWEDQWVATLGGVVYRGGVLEDVLSRIATASRLITPHPITDRLPK